MPLIHQVPAAVELQIALRSSGYVTNGQAWELAEFLHLWLSTNPKQPAPPWPSEWPMGNPT